jgi:hypothetical protein
MTLNVIYSSRFMDSDNFIEKMEKYIVLSMKMENVVWMK